MSENIDPNDLAKKVLADVAKDEEWSPLQKAVGNAGVDVAELKDTPISPSMLEAGIVQAVEKQFPGIRLGAPKNMVRGMGDQVGVYTVGGIHMADIYAPDLPEKSLRFTVENLTADLERQNFSRS